MRYLLLACVIAVAIVGLSAEAPALERRVIGEEKTVISHHHRGGGRRGGGWRHGGGYYDGGSYGGGYCR